MSRIVYGVSGEGSGHSSRARVMADHLQREGHTVKIVSYDRGYKNLRADFDCVETAGLHIESRDNRVSATRTFGKNFSRLPRFVSDFRRLKRELFGGFQPHCVISDFEPMTAYLARVCGLPLISLDNQHRIRYMNLPCPKGLRLNKWVTANVIRGMIPTPDVSLVTTFYFGEVTNDRTFLFPPILRELVLEQSPVCGDHVLVYHTQTYDSFIAALKEFPRERFIVYGYDREGEDGSICYKPFSVEGFMHDVATSKAVMGTAGFTLMTESLYLRKPYLATPLVGQFEQELNAVLLEGLGYGKNAPELTQDTIGEFLKCLPEYDARLAEYRSEGNGAIKVMLSSLVADDAALARQYRARRRNKAQSVTLETN